MAKKRKSNDNIWEWCESERTRKQDDLCFGGRVLATLRWQGCFSQRAVASSPDGQWIFDRPRLLSRDIEVYDPSERLVAVLRVGLWGDGTLETVGGYVFYWRLQGFFQAHGIFEDSAGRPVAEFWDTSRFFRPRTQVVWPPASLSAKDRALLAALGHYVMILKQRDTAAVVAATCVTVV